MDKPFWEQPLESLNSEQWEQLCDGCARCCLIKLEDEETGERFTTCVVCRYLDLETCRCTEYARRAELVPSCVQVTAENVRQLDWMPSSCAYRLRAENRPLPEWHPLVSGTPDSVHEAGISVRHFAISEAGIDDDELEEYIID